MSWMVADRTGRFGVRPHYKAGELDRDCECIITAFLQKRLGEVRFPVTTDELQVLIEQHGASLDAYADLSGYGEDVEGVTEFYRDREPEVFISERLANDARRENRVRTTLTHEFGHRHQEFIKFLRKIDRSTPADLDLHLVADNYATHKQPDVVKWLERHPRFHMHFIPTSSSWLNLVERFFAEITRKRIRRGAFKSVLDLEVAIYRYLGEHNDHPTRFVWTKTAAQILEKVERARAALKTVVGTK